MRFKEEIVIQASPDVIFEKYRDVESWKSWDFDVRESELLGEFQIGSFGVLVPTKGPNAKIELTEVTLNRSFTSQAKLPLCIMKFSHQLEDLGESTKVIHSVSFSGLTSSIFGRLIGAPIRKSLPKTLNALKAACE